MQNVESYIYFYNYKRIHSEIGYMTPTQKMAELEKWFEMCPRLTDHYNMMEISRRSKVNLSRYLTLTRGGF